jgi:hypothetical protein
MTWYSVRRPAELSIRTHSLTSFSSIYFKFQPRWQSGSHIMYAQIQSKPVRVPL